MKRTTLFTGIVGMLLLLMILPVTSHGCTWDIEPTGGDGDVDGFDLVTFSGGTYNQTQLTEFAAEFGRSDCYTYDTQAIESGMDSSTHLYNIKNQTTYYCAEGVFQASIQGAGGQWLVTTGTLTQEPNDPTVFIYSADLTDRLRIIFTDGTQLDFFVIAMDGDFSSNATTFLERPHHLHYRVVRSGELDLTIESHRISTGYYTSDTTVMVNGTFVRGGVTYTANITYIRNYYHEGDSSGYQTESNEAATGSVTATGFALTVNESTSAIIVSTSIRTSSSSSRTMNNTWTSNGNLYALQNGLINRAFRNGRPNELDTVWQAQGILLLDGVQIGQISLEVHPTLAFLEIYLNTADGQKFLIEKWHTHVAGH